MASITQLEKDIRKGRKTEESYNRQLRTLKEKIVDSGREDKEIILQAIHSAEAILELLFKKEAARKEMMHNTIS